MKKLNLEDKMEKLHLQMNLHEQVKGTILLRANGIHVSSKLSNGFDSRRLSAHIATIFRYISKKNQAEEAKIQLENGIDLFMKSIPSRKIILTSITNNATSPELNALMDRFAKEFQDIL